LQWRRRQALPLARRRRRVIILMLRRPPAPPLFPYTTLFRSQSRARDPNGTARCARGGGPAGGCRGTHRVPRRCASVADPQGVRSFGISRGPSWARGLPPRASGGGMATAVDRRGSDHRRSPVLAAPKDGRVRGETSIPAHRAGRRIPVGGPGLRWGLGLLTAGVTLIVALVFLIPLGVLLDRHARAEAL